MKAFFTASGFVIFLSLGLGLTQARADRYCGGVYTEAEAATLSDYKNRLGSAAKGASLVVPKLSSATTEATQPGQDAFIFAGDLHGSWPMFGALLTALDLLNPNYLALEVAEDPVQKGHWEKFNNTSLLSSEFPVVSHAVNLILESWNLRYPTWASPYNEMEQANWANRPMLALVHYAKRKGVKIIPIDAQDCYRLSAPVGHRSVLVRNYTWAKNIFSLKGKTIVFGGRPHFSSPLPDNVQDYVAELRSEQGLSQAAISFVDHASPEEIKFETEFVNTQYTDLNY